MIKIKQLLPVSILMLATSTAFAASDNFNCPNPGEIQSTDFTAPSIWTAPPVAHSAPGVVGVGLGGKLVKEFLGAQPVTVNHKKGWVCVYKSEGGMSVNEYQTKITEIVKANPYLKKSLNNVNKAFENAEPFLSKYPQDTGLGFVGYQSE